MLLHHVIAGDLPIADMVAAIRATSPAPVEFASLLGATLEFTLVAGDVIVSPAQSNIDATVGTYDLDTCVGMLHIVDTVLVPEYSAALPRKTAAGPRAAPACVPLREAAGAAGLNSFVDAVKALRCAHSVSLDLCYSC
ncbi:MAG: hypothetical protein HC767_13940 [Akkermansiaceae bacterium]|nr:hypothetical protein [Akkermansiaceae bacterium]